MYANAQIVEFRGNTIRALNDDAEGGEMNRDRIHGVWKQFEGSVKEQWGTLSSAPRMVAAGKRDRIAGRIEEQRGVSKQQADRQLEDFMQRNRNWQDLSQH
ncbi:MAG: CsbD family protein [Burkholderiales bacterium]